MFFDRKSPPSLEELISHSHLSPVSTFVKTGLRNHKNAVTDAWINYFTKGNETQQPHA